MTEKLNEALNNVEMTYAELIPIANDMLQSIVSSANSIIDELNAKVNNLSVDQIRDFILRLQLKAYEISEIKEKAIMKSTLAEALQKEHFAVRFNGFDGSAAVKERLALVATSEEIVIDALYTLIANLLKNKVDQIHRMVDSLKSILMSRMQEAKFMNLGAAEDPDQYKTVKQIYEENSRRI